MGIGWLQYATILATTAQLDDNSSTDLVRANFYFVAKHTFNQNTHFIGTAYYQPVVGEVGDFRALG